MSLSQVNEALPELCLLGNEAAARGALEAGVEGVFAYPGTPSTEISMSFFELARRPHGNSPSRIDPAGKALPPYFEYSINEKVAMEKHHNAVKHVRQVNLLYISNPFFVMRLYLSHYLRYVLCHLP